MYYSPLRYPGGKAKLAGLVRDVFIANNLVGCTYVEPYAGGAGVALHLLFEGYAKKIIINDIDYNIYAFWESSVNNTDVFCGRIEDTPVTMDSWYEQRIICENPQQYSLHEVGFATFFMNRTNRSGIIKGGVIGGKKQNGPHKLDARYNKGDLISRIYRIAALRGNISIHNHDAISLAANIVDKQDENLFFYFDPPYFHKANTLYRNCYNDNDHKNVAAFVKSLNAPWMVTYDNVQEIKELYADYGSIDLTINYSAYRAGSKGKEVLFYSGIIPPNYLKIVQLPLKYNCNA